MTTADQPQGKTSNLPAQMLTAQSLTQQNPSRLTTSQIRTILTSDRIPADALIKRVSVCLAAYFDPDQDPEIRAGVRKMYAKALGDLPGFAVTKAFSEWEKTGSRRPTPADLRLIAERQLEPYNRVLEKRREEAEQAAADKAERERNRVTPEAAARIMAEAGFTEERIGAIQRFPLARSQQQAADKMHEFQTPGSHWSDTADPDGPEWAALRAARARNVLIPPQGG